LTSPSSPPSFSKKRNDAENRSLIFGRKQGAKLVLFLFPNYKGKNKSRVPVYIKNREGEGEGVRMRANDFGREKLRNIAVFKKKKEKETRGKI